MNMGDAFNTKRYKKVMKAIPFVAGATDSLPLCGPCNELIWECKGSTTTHTLGGNGNGLARWARRVVFISNKRGTIGDMDSAQMLDLSLQLFGVGFEVDTAAGAAAAEGCAGILPLSADADEVITMQVEFNTQVALDGGGAGSAGFAGTLRCELGVINGFSPSTYQAYRKQMLGASGVIGINAGFQQPQVPTIPGFYLTGELLATYTTNQAANEVMVLNEVRVTQSDDYLIDDFVGLLVLNQSRKRYGVSVNAAGAVRSLLLRHIPVTASDVTNVFVTNAGVATINPSNILYIYLGGRISGEGVTAAYRSETELETNVIPTPQNKTPLAGTVQPYAGAGAPMGGPVGSAPGWRGSTGTQGSQFGPLTGRRTG